METGGGGGVEKVEVGAGGVQGGSVGDGEVRVGGVVCWIRWVGPQKVFRV